MQAKIILVGARANGILALNKYGKENIAYFCDNSVEKQGQEIEGVQVIDFEKLCKIYDCNKHVIMVTPDNNFYLTEQLKMSGITDYILFQKNVDINLLDICSNYKKTYHKENSELDHYVNKSKTYDLLADVQPFIEDVEEVLKRNREGLELAYLGGGGEGEFYGNLQTLLQFADYGNYEKEYAPLVSHNALMPRKITEASYSTACVFSGDYYKENIHKLRPYVPVFTVGPYIQYAKGIYSTEKIQQIKKEQGRILTIFLPHSIEKINRNYNKEKFISEVVDRYSKEFDTIKMSVYWADMDKAMYDYATDIGVDIVTAGFRFDPGFNNRLRSILDMSDAIAGGDFGTHYVYAAYMKLPASKINISDNTSIGYSEFTGKLERMIEFGSEYDRYITLFNEAYDEKVRYSDKQQEVFAPYAGYRYSRSKEYIRAIFDISKSIFEECGGSLKGYPAAVKKVYENYDSNGKFYHMKVLTESVGNYIYY